MLRIITVVAATLAAPACNDETLLTEENYGIQAKEAYESGLKAFEDGYFQEAIDHFNRVKNKFPYSEYARMAELKAADANFERESFTEAAEAYRIFARMHPKAAEAGYAYFRVGEAYFQQMPEDWWILPPSYERDLSSTYRAISAYEDFLQRFPQNENATTARDRINYCRTRLAKHEQYVARFYIGRGQWLAAKLRLAGLAKQFGDLPIADETYPDMALAQVQLGAFDDAMQTVRAGLRTVRDPALTESLQDLEREIRERQAAAPPHTPVAAPATPAPAALPGGEAGVVDSNGPKEIQP